MNLRSKSKEILVAIALWAIWCATGNLYGFIVTLVIVGIAYCVISIVRAKLKDAHYRSLKPWQKIHLQGNIAYDQIAEITKPMAALSQEFHTFMACKTLAATLLGKEVDDPHITEMMNVLKDQNGSYPVSVLYQAINDLKFGESYIEDNKQMLQAAERFFYDNCKMGPSLTIARVIDELYGSVEASHYLTAIMKRDVALR